MADLYGLPSADDEALKSGDPSIGKQILFRLISSALGTSISPPRGPSVAEQLAVKKYGTDLATAEEEAKRKAALDSTLKDVALYTARKAEAADFNAENEKKSIYDWQMPKVADVPESLKGLGDLNLTLGRHSSDPGAAAMLKTLESREGERKAVAGIDEASRIMGPDADKYTGASFALGRGFAGSAPGQSATGTFAPLQARQDAKIKEEEQARGYGYDVEKENLSHKNAMELKMTAPGANPLTGGVDANGEPVAYRGKPPSGDAIKTLGLLADGASAAATIIDKLDSGNADIWTRSVFGDFKDPEVSMAFQEINDVLGRMRSGGAINADELKSFQSMTGDPKYLATAQGRKALSNALRTRMGRWMQSGDDLYGSPSWREKYNLPTGGSGKKPDASPSSSTKPPQKTPQKTPTPPAPGIAVGTIANGYRFKGGDKNNSNNWEKVQ